MTAVASYRRAGARRQRELVTPEGLSLPLTVASRGARAGALLVDLVLIFLAPLFLAFEVWQLVMSERYLGIKQIARHGDPRTLGLAELTAFCWCAMLAVYVAWMLSLLLMPFGRIHGLGLLAVLGVA